MGVPDTCIINRLNDFGLVGLAGSSSDTARIVNGVALLVGLDTWV